MINDVFWDHDKDYRDYLKNKPMNSNQEEKNDLFDEQVKMDHKAKVDTGIFRRVDKEGNLCFMRNINGKLEVVNKIRPIQRPIRCKNCHCDNGQKNELND